MNRVQFSAFFRLQASLKPASSVALSLLLLGLAIPSCVSTSPQTCQEADWYEIGRREGALGSVPRDRKDLKPLCETSQTKAPASLYSNGHYAGLLEYCSPENAFEVGRLGKPISTQCPPSARDDYMFFYQQGRRSAELEKAAQKLDQKMSNLTKELNKQALGTDSHNEIKQELKQLKNRQAKINAELSRLR